MAMFTWNGNPTGDWDDESNWYNDTEGKSNDGYPGAGDTAVVNTTEVDVSGDTIANLRAFTTDIDGNITVTNEIEGGTFTDGDVKAGTVQGCIFEGLSLTANTIDAGNLDAGTVTTTVLVTAAIDGAAVTAQSIERDPSGQYASYCYVSVASGSLTADTMTLVGPSAAINLSDFFLVSGGTATITGNATATGANVAIESDGGTLRFSDGLTLSNGAAFYGRNGGKTTVETLTAGETGNSTIDVENAGSTLTVVKALTLGNCAVTLAKGGALIVDGAFDMAENAGSTSTATIGDAGATLTIRGEWQIGVAGTATPMITKGVTAEALGGIMDFHEQRKQPKIFRASLI